MASYSENPRASQAQLSMALKEQTHLGGVLFPLASKGQDETKHSQARTTVKWARKEPRRANEKRLKTEPKFSSSPSFCQSENLLDDLKDMDTRAEQTWSRYVQALQASKLLDGSKAGAIRRRAIGKSLIGRASLAKRKLVLQQNLIHEQEREKERQRNQMGCLPTNVLLFLHRINFSVEEAMRSRLPKEMFVAMSIADSSVLENDALKPSEKLVKSNCGVVVNQDSIRWNAGEILSLRLPQIKLPSFVASNAEQHPRVLIELCSTDFILRRRRVIAMVEHDLIPQLLNREGNTRLKVSMEPGANKLMSDAEIEYSIQATAS